MIHAVSRFRIQLGQWIWIQNGKSGPQKWKIFEISSFEEEASYSSKYFLVFIFQFFQPYITKVIQNLGLDTDFNINPVGFL